ncbi:CsxC family protein [Tepidibacter thalassicus]|uniref:DUF7852 domain-containing protein n=1 Tax=Tepidibacter thalassicus DSM 15285 TaxID=1123350 RepID=A0A1M5S8S3_9FIRM|nr:hypothetical protein [Tepidibacter thalassicus]SHH34889.1 hypothetical protein SAMN02744040_01667 [Tepidibacter thalassicus DSM 15285]
MENNIYRQANCVDVYGGTIETCTNTKENISPIKNVVAKIPVVLAEFTLQINVLSNIELPEDAIEIKNIKKRLKITQCMLLQNTNVLFIKGFVRKNIDYSTRSCSNSEGVCGDIKHCTVDVPFQCTTEVTFNGTPPAPVVPNSSFEFEYHKVEDLPNQFAEKDKLVAGDLSEYNQESTEYFNELPYCELVKSRIVEFDEYINRKTPENEIVPFEEKEFNKIEEKMVIYLTLKLLQNRQVKIPAPEEI